MLHRALNQNVLYITLEKILLKLCFKNNYSWIFGALYQSINGTTQPPKQEKFKFGHGKKSGRVKDCIFCLPGYFEETICDQKQLCIFCLEKKICRHVKALSEVAETQNNKKSHSNLHVNRTMAQGMQFVTGLCDLDSIVCLWGHFLLSEERQNFYSTKAFVPVTSQEHVSWQFPSSWCVFLQWLNTHSAFRWAEPPAQRHDKDRSWWNTMQTDWQPGKAASR